MYKLNFLYSPNFLRKSKLYSLIILATLIFLSFFGAMSLRYIKTHYAMHQFLPEAHPLIIKDDQVKATFGLLEIEPVIALLQLGKEEKGTWLEKNRTEKLRDVSDLMAKEQGVLKTISIATVEGASDTKAGVNVGRLLELTEETKWRERILKDPLLTPSLISQDARTVLVLLSTEVISTERAGELIQQLRAQLQTHFPQSVVRIGGVPAVQSEMSSILGDELFNFLSLALLASMLTLFAFFRTFSSVVIPVFVMVLANIASLAWMALTGVSFTVLSTTLPVLVSITVISMATHTMLRYSSDWEMAKKVQKNPNKLKILFESFIVLSVPNFLTAVTTAVGFFAIGYTKIPLIQQYGITVGISIFLAWLSIMVALPPLLVLFPVPIARDWTSARARWSLLMIRYKKQVFVSIMIICGFLLAQGNNLNWSAKLFDDLPQNKEARLSTEMIDRDLGGMIPLSVVIKIKNEDQPWNSPLRISKMSELLDAFRKKEEVGSAVGLSDFLRTANLKDSNQLPITRASAAESIFLYSFSEVNPLNQFLTPDGESVRLYLRLRDVPAEKMASFVAFAKAEAEKIFSGAEVQTAGMATTVHVLNNELCKELIFGFWQALLMISLLLLFVFRSLRWTIAAVLPNLVAPIVLIGVLAIANTPIKPGIALIFSIALGIAFDNTVYLLGRLRYLSKNSVGNQMPIAKAWYQEGNLCLFSSMALSVGFAVFLASYFSLNKLFGAYMLVSIIGGLIGDLILLPVMISMFPKMLSPVKKIVKNPEQIKIEEQKNMRKQIAAGLVFSFFLTSSISAWSNTIDPKNADQILKEVEKNVSSNDEAASIKMVIVEANGSQKDRSIEIKRKSGSKQRVMVRMQSPADLKGTALLSVGQGTQSDQWLYLPSSKQTRRILSSKKNSSFMDSELSYEDLGTSSDKKFTNKVLREEVISGRKFAVIESTASAGDSSYTKILTWVELGNYLVAKMEYYDTAGKLLKTSQLSGYKKFDQGVWRAQKIQVKNVQNNRSTILELNKLSLNKGLDDAEFTESALSDAD